MILKKSMKRRDFFKGVKRADCMSCILIEVKIVAYIRCWGDVPIADKLLQLMSKAIRLKKKALLYALCYMGCTQPNRFNGI